MVFEKTISSTREATRKLLREAMDFFAQLKKQGYGVNVSEFSMRLVVDEALENAVRHGNKFNCDKTIFFKITGHKTKINVEIRDQGTGFQPDCVADPLHASNLFAPSGRGLLLLSHLSKVTWNSEGNCISIELPL